MCCCECLKGGLEEFQGLKKVKVRLLGRNCLKEEALC